VIERDVMESHFDAIEAHIALSDAQNALSRAQLLSAREHYKRLVEQRTPKVAVEIPEKCKTQNARLCMEQGADSAPCGQSVMCRACGDVRQM
jgi:hypothetical protein